MRERSQEANRLHKTLEDTGIKLDCVATDILGVSGRLMLDALLAGERDPRALAALAKGRLRAKSPALIEAFEGVRFGAQNALLIGGILRHIDFLDAEIAALGDAIEMHLAAERKDGTLPFEPAVRVLCSLDGIQARTAEMLLGEFGTDMSRFPTDKHFASWAAQCPGNHQSAGKRQSGKTRKGPKWLDGALHDAAMGAIRVKDGHFARKYRRIKGPVRAQGRDRRDQARDPDRDLPHAQERRAVPPTNRSPRRRAQTARTDHQTPARPARTPRAHRHATNGNSRGGGRTLNVFSYQQGAFFGCGTPPYHRTTGIRIYVLWDSDLISSGISMIPPTSHREVDLQAFSRQPPSEAQPFGCCAPCW